MVWWDWVLRRDIAEQAHVKVWEEDEIVDKVYAELSAESIDVLRRTSVEDLIYFHNTVGRHIRNTYNLWDHPRAQFDPYGDHHPDNWSMRIIERVHARVVSTYGALVNSVAASPAKTDVFGVDITPRGG